MNVPLAVLLSVFVLIAVRQVGGLRFGIWQVMLSGALAVLLTGQISPSNAIKAINVDVMLFLFGMFVVGAALQESGYLSHLGYLLFRRVKNADRLILMLVFSTGILSAFLMNDTLAIIGTPLVLYLADRHGIPPKVMLLSLAFAVTTGSAMSPIGNPQNLLIAIGGGLKTPFVTFFGHLAVPTLINLFLVYALLKLFYGGECFRNKPLMHRKEEIKDGGLARLSKISLALMAVLVLVKIAIALSGSRIDFGLTCIALAAAAPIILFSEKRLKILGNMDWKTLVFFAAMFVLMESVWETGLFQSITAALNVNFTSVGTILPASILISQFVSNVPFVALYLPLLLQAGPSANGMAALAAGSTIAGNLFILGAASNVIIIQNAEKMGETLTFWEFARIGIPLTILNVIVYWLFLSIG